MQSISTRNPSPGSPAAWMVVRAGRRFTITNRGEAVADLVPSAAGISVDAAAAIDRFRAFMGEHPLKARRRVDVRALIKEGRE